MELGSNSGCVKKIISKDMQFSMARNNWIETSIFVWNNYMKKTTIINHLLRLHTQVQVMTWS